MPLLQKDRPKPKVAAKLLSKKLSVPTLPVVGQPKKARKEKKNRPTAESLPCIHRGQVQRVETCETCGERGKPREIYACELFGECAVRRWQRAKAGQAFMATCNVCEQRKET